MLLLSSSSPSSPPPTHPALQLHPPTRRPSLDVQGRNPYSEESRFWESSGLLDLLDGLLIKDPDKRLGCDYNPSDCYYHVRGKYGGSRNEDVDDMISDTRWVQLTELVRNMSEPQLAELDSWAGRLQKTAKAARKRVRQQQRSEE